MDRPISRMKDNIRIIMILEFELRIEGRVNWMF
jgi:hypothetical protein